MTHPLNGKSQGDSERVTDDLESNSFVEDGSVLYFLPAIMTISHTPILLCLSWYLSSFTNTVTQTYMPLKQRTWRSSALPVLLFFLIFIQLPSSIRSQSSCAPLTDPTCSAFISGAPSCIINLGSLLTNSVAWCVAAVGTPVFVPEGSTLAFQELIVNRYVNVLNYAGFPEPCRSYSIQVFCASWLRPCFVIDNRKYSSEQQKHLTFFHTETIPVPQEPCIETCQDYSMPTFQLSYD